MWFDSKPVGSKTAYPPSPSEIFDSLNIVVQIERRPGSRYVSEVLEISGYDTETDRYELDSVYHRK
jgi:hypothetical protein